MKEIQRDCKATQMKQVPVPGVRWFEEFATPNRFTMETANATVDGQGFYAAIIVENTNPMLEAIVSDFKQTAESLTGEKP